LGYGNLGRSTSGEFSGSGRCLVRSTKVTDESDSQTPLQGLTSNNHVTWANLSQLLQSRLYRARSSVIRNWVGSSGIIGDGESTTGRLTSNLQLMVCTTKSLWLELCNFRRGRGCGTHGCGKNVTLSSGKYCVVIQ